MRFNRRRRGVSYILEVVMMTIVIVALASVVLTWGLGTITDTRNALTGAVNSRMDRIQEGLVIEDVQYESPTSLLVWVRNVGAIQSVVDQVYVQNIESPIVQTCPPPSYTCSAGYTLSLSIQAVGAVIVNVSSSVVVVADSGTATSTTSSTLTDSTKAWSANQWAPGQGYSFSLVVGGVSYKISSNTATPPT
ncbi:MAG: hypothetical protein JRN24_02130, partial [Nitrososphaerota archaeon]|nr:hypothetical protein [Nitrososphaerota archaeon]